MKYPELELIATAPVKTVKPDVLDEHFYVRATENLHTAQPLRHQQRHRADDVGRRAV